MVDRPFFDRILTCCATSYGLRMAGGPYTGMPQMWETIGAVCRVTSYEAEAYACFVGMRLPTEAEWEKAVSWNSAE